VIGEWADQADEGNTSIVTAQYVTIGGAFDFSEPMKDDVGEHVPEIGNARKSGTTTGASRQVSSPVCQTICKLTRNL